MLTMTRTVIIRHTQMRALLQLWEGMTDQTRRSRITGTLIEINVIHVHKVFDARRLYSTLDLLCREGIHSVRGWQVHPLDQPVTHLRVQSTRSTRLTGPSGRHVDSRVWPIKTDGWLVRLNGPTWQVDLVGLLVGMEGLGPRVNSKMKTYKAKMLIWWGGPMDNKWNK